MNRWRRYPRLRRQATQGHPLWRGRSSRSYCAFRKRRLPSSVNAIALRPFRVGMTQSNRSMPRPMASNRSSGRPTPIRYRGRSAGNSGRSLRASAACRPAPRRRSARPPRSRRNPVPAVAAHRRRGVQGRARLGRWRTALGRFAVAASRHRRAQRMDRSAASRTTSRSLGNPTTWSSTIATSLPKSSWMATARSGEMATRRPSTCERKTASCSVTSMQMGQAEQLEAAAVGQDRSVPTHEAVQSAEGGDDLFAGPQCEMIGIAQDHFRPGSADLFDLQSLHAGLGGHGHEGRHCTSPCGVEKTARRAAQWASA